MRLNEGPMRAFRAAAFAEDAIAKSRDAYHKLTSLAKDNAKVAEEVMLTTQAGAKSIGEKIVANTLAKAHSTSALARIPAAKLPAVRNRPLSGKTQVDHRFTARTDPR